MAETVPFAEIEMPAAPGGTVMGGIQGKTFGRHDAPVAVGLQVAGPRVGWVPIGLLHDEEAVSLDG